MLTTFSLSPVARFNEPPWVAPLGRPAVGTTGAGCVFSLRFLLACLRLAHAALPRFPFCGIGPFELPAHTPMLLVAHRPPRDATA